jgi:hypothetical protein
MYHILAAKRHRQDGAFGWKNQALRLASANPPSLVEGAIAVLTSIGGMDQQVDLAGACRLLDPFGTGQQCATSRFQAKAVQRLLAERGLDPFAEVRRDGEVIRLEGAGERSLQLALGIGFVERLATDADPGAAARRAGADIGGDLTVRAKREPDQLLPRRGPPGEDAGSLGAMRL